MPTEVTSLLFQAGAVGVFIFYAITSNRANAAERKEQTIIWQALLEGERKEREARDIAWREMVADDRMQREDTANRHEDYFSRIHEMSQAVESLASAMGSHDLSAQGRQKEILAAIARLRKLVPSE